MARARAAAVLFAVACCLLVAPAPARRPVEPPPQVVPDAVDREAAAESLLLKPVAEEDDVGPARQVSSLLCLVFRCDGDEVALSSSEETPSLDGWAQPVGKAEVEDGQERPCDSDSDSDSSDSDSDWDWDSDEDEGGIVGWLWRLAHRF